MSILFMFIRILHKPHYKQFIGTTFYQRNSPDFLQFSLDLREQQRHCLLKDLMFWGWMQKSYK